MPFLRIAVVVAGLCLLPAGPAHAAFPGTNGVIAFDYWPSSASDTQIYTVDPSSHVIKNISRTHTGDDQSAISPNGKRILFRHGGDIWVMNVNGAARKDITPGLHTGSQPAWSPDGKQIVFNDNNQLAVMTATGANLHTIVTDADSTDPTWSPDGTSIAFVSDRSGTAQIWRVKPSGRFLYDVSRANRYSENQPDWSPDGTHIAFNTDRSDDGLRQIFASDPAGTTKTEIASALPSGAYDPAYSPDGTDLAYIANIEGSLQIVLRSAGAITTTLVGTTLENLSWGSAPAS